MELFNVYPLYDVTLERGKGCQVFDDKGNAYLDLYGGHGVISIGHSHPDYVEAIQAQVGKLGYYSNSVVNPLQEELAQRLGKVSGCEDYALFLCNSGAEANENALKLASFHTEKHKVIAFEGGFHGRTSAAVAVTDNARINAPLNTQHQVELLPLNDLALVKEVMENGDVASVIVEGVQGVGGLNQGDTAFFRGLSQLCKQYNAVLILDEVQSGYGRSGKFFAYQHHGIEPDLVTVAKGMGNGFPIGGVLISDRFEAWYGMLGTTFGGNHLACAAGISVLKVIEKEGLMENVKTLASYFRKSAVDIPGVSRIKGRGLMLGLEFEGPVAEIRKKLIFEKRIFTGGSANPNLLRILPPLSIGKEDIDHFIRSLREVIQSMVIESKD